ncbi:hypothetical protein O6H91_Y337700 [Diphasiastrum complanatum]|nr:hypothetical protein O6H91_Y337700 [Diphasiastrum complanatum]
MRGRIKEEDSSVPLRKGPYFYYTKNLEGKQYKIHCRRAIYGGEGPGSFDEVMTPETAGPEEVLLDENEKALQSEFFIVQAVKVSPNHRRVAYNVDTKGDEFYTIHVFDIESKKLVGKPVIGATEQVEWVDDDTLVYVTQDDTRRPYKAWRHELHTEQSQDVCLYHEEDEEYFLDIISSESEEYLFVLSGSKMTSFILYMKKNSPAKELRYLTQRIKGIDTIATHRGGHFFIKQRSEDAFNSELLICPIEDVSKTSILIPHRESVKLDQVEVSRDHLIVYEREDGLENIIVYSLPKVGQPIENLANGRRLQFSETVYSILPKEFQFNSSILRYSYSSLRTPPSVYDYDMNTGESSLKKRQEVLGDFDIEHYEIVRRWACAEDGSNIPISIVYRKDLVKLDGTDPLLLYGYGSYEVVNEPSFRGESLSLLNRGIVFAIAHIRGGGEMGRKWYDDGKLFKKKNTFTDFICSAEYLLANKFGAKEKLCIHGRSAGGLLIGAVLTMKPDLFRCAIAEVAFVDVLTTMLDSSIPLTTAEYEEWGNPNIKDYYTYIKSYSPVDNVSVPFIHYMGLFLNVGD